MTRKRSFIYNLRPPLTVEPWRSTPLPAVSLYSEWASDDMRFISIITCLLLPANMCVLASDWLWSSAVCSGCDRALGVRACDRVLCVRACHRSTHLFADTHEVPSIDTIDMYMAKLHTLILDSPQENELLIANVREIVGRLNFEGWQPQGRQPHPYL